MPCEVVVAVEGADADVAALSRFADACAASLDRADAEWSLVLADDAFVQALNAEYRDIATPTDVLSFPQLEFPDGPNRGPAAVLGDVVISLETAARQAAEHGHPLLAELEVLLVHGLCHLLGWDHEDPADRAAMLEAEGRVLEAVGRSAMGLVRRAGG